MNKKNTYYQILLKIAQFIAPNIANILWKIQEDSMFSIFVMHEKLFSKRLLGNVM